RTRRFGTGARVGPGAGVRAVGDRVAHHPVVGGMELDLVDAVAPAIVGVQYRRAGVGQLRVALIVGRADQGPNLGDLVYRPVRAVPADGLDQGCVGGELVDVHARGGLVEHLVGGVGIG